MTDTPATVVEALENLRELGIDEDEIYLLKQRVVAVFDAMLAARPALSAGAVGERDQIARIIDPETFDLIEHYNDLPFKPEGEAPEVSTFRAYPQLKERRDAAFAKADAILALTPRHDSDCATHNEPAYPNGPCDCTALTPREETQAEAGEGDLADKLTAIRDKFLMPTPDKDHTDYAIITRCIEALRARSSEPVAWRYRCLDPQGHWLMTDHAPTNAVIVDRPNVWEVQPLYTHPAADPDKLREA